MQSASTRAISGLQKYEPTQSSRPEKPEPRLDLFFELAVDEFTGTVRVSVRGPNKVSIKENEDVQITGGKYSAIYIFGGDEVELWCLIGYGKQPLYEIEVVVIDDVSIFSGPADEGISQPTTISILLGKIAKGIKLGIDRTA